MTLKAISSNVVRERRQKKKGDKVESPKTTKSTTRPKRRKVPQRPRNNNHNNNPRSKSSTSSAPLRCFLSNTKQWRTWVSLSNDQVANQSFLFGKHAQQRQPCLLCGLTPPRNTSYEAHCATNHHRRTWNLFQRVQDMHNNNAATFDLVVRKLDNTQFSDSVSFKVKRGFLNDVCSAVLQSKAKTKNVVLASAFDSAASRFRVLKGSSEIGGEDAVDGQPELVPTKIFNQNSILEPVQENVSALDDVVEVRSAGTEQAKVEAPKHNEKKSSNNERNENEARKHVAHVASHPVKEPGVVPSTDSVVANTNVKEEETPVRTKEGPKLELPSLDSVDEHECNSSPMLFENDGAYCEFPLNYRLPPVELTTIDEGWDHLDDKMERASSCMAALAFLDVY